MSAAKRSNKAIEVRIEPVQKRDLVASVTASGQVRPHTKVDVASDVSGKIIKLAVKEGRLVSAASSCCRSTRRSAQAARAARRGRRRLAKAQMTQAQANLDQAQSELRPAARRSRSRIRSSSPTTQMEQLKTAVDVNTALVDAGKAHQSIRPRPSLDNAKSALDKTTIYAPMAGRVTRLIVEQGETAIQGTLNKDAATLLTISDMSVLETKVKVDETDVARIKVGDSAQSSRSTRSPTRRSSGRSRRSRTAR